ncbi:hypothetical protein M3Y99_00023500 [Aphelenchoides fujianensis]|nr:hypothetical protein M3Y99_00023500 [Aphelenchoides fujianensis]
MCLIDTSILVVTFSLVWLMERKNAAHFMDVLRFVQILRLLHIDRQMVSFSLIKEMIAESKFELVTIYYITVFLLALLACVVYTIEEDAMANATFANYGESFWFSAVSIFTIGYGDIVPQTWQGKAVVCVLAYLGLLMFGAASTLVGVQMSLQLDNRNKKEKKDKARILAACLIQSWWRYHLITNEKTFKTIKVYRDFLRRAERRDGEAAARSAVRPPRTESFATQRAKFALDEEDALHGQRGTLQPISTANGSLSSQFDLRNTLKTHAATAIYVSASDLNVADDIESTRSLPRSEDAIGIAEDGPDDCGTRAAGFGTRSTSIRTPLALLRRKVESGIMGRLLRDASVETNDSQLPDREEADDLYDNPSVTSTITLMSDRRSMTAVEAPVLTGRHRAILRLLYFMLFMSLKKKFSRARKPYELNDAEQELLELEHKRMRALRQLEKKFERTIGAKAAEEAENEAPQTKMAGVEEKVLGLEQMILQIAQLMEDREVQLVEDSPPRFLHPLSQ